MVHSVSSFRISIFLFPKKSLVFAMDGSPGTSPETSYYAHFRLDLNLIQQFYYLQID